MLDINTPSLDKRWFGYKTQCKQLAKLAILVNYKCNEKGGVSAFIYITEELIEGETCEVLAYINNILNIEYKKAFNETPPNTNKFGFFTQPWQGEKRRVADGELFYVPPWEKNNK